MNDLRRVLILALLAFTLVIPEGRADTSTPLGTWYLNANGARMSVMISRGPRAGTFPGSLIREDGGRKKLDAISWEASSGRLEFRFRAAGLRQWFRGTIVEGIFTGRFAESAESQADPVSLEAYKFHVTGWNSGVFDQSLVPRVYELLLNHEYRARLRIDAGLRGLRFAGRLKIYSSVSAGAAGEELEYDVEITQWDGRNLTFIRRLANSAQYFRGFAKDRSVSGVYTESGKRESFAWSGTRAELLSYGLLPKSVAARGDWQEQTRRRLLHLMMGGNPAPLSTEVATLASGLLPNASEKLPPERDDDPGSWPQNYRVTELSFSFLLPNPYGGSSIVRRAHAYLAVPSTPAPAGGKYPAVLAVNGHGGSAWKMFQPDDVHYWYGDAFARRGYVVLALDISHRPTEDRRAPFMTEPLYTDPESGDDPVHGNGAHPAVKAAGFDSDWEEDGERVWDAMRALDYLSSLPQVDTSRLLVTGLSMGGTVTAMVSALDPRVTLSLAAVPSADLGVMLYKGNHPCWRWQHGDVREYFDSSDLFALIAPRPLVVMTGKADSTYSKLSSPFAADKQILRRARAAYATDSDNLIHYLHYDGHRFHVGDTNPTKPTEPGVRVPLLVAPETPGSTDWQLDARTRLRWATLLECLRALLRQN